MHVHAQAQVAEKIHIGYGALAQMTTGAGLSAPQNAIFTAETLRRGEKRT
jgi:hypothetical protein